MVELFPMPVGIRAYFYAVLLDEYTQLLIIGSDRSTGDHRHILIWRPEHHTATLIDTQDQPMQLDLSKQF
jgi:hypothetical protein